MRHGRPAPGPPGDAELSSEGRAEVVAAARRLWLSTPRPAFIAHSPLTRSRESAELLASAWDAAPPLETWESLGPAGEPPEILRPVDERLAAGQIALLVSHAPVLHALFQACVGGGLDPGPWRTAELRRIAFPGPIGIGFGHVAGVSR